MEKITRPTHHSREQPGALALILAHIQARPGSTIKASDIDGASPAAINRALSRLVQQGAIQRIRKGIYYQPVDTLLGKSQPSGSAVLQKLLGNKIRPTGVTAANILGLSTQIPGQAEYAVFASSRPRGADSAHLRFRPRSRVTVLKARDAALLEFIRARGRHGELSPEETFEQIKKILLEEPGRGNTEADPPRCSQLRDAALAEPPRVRAILGALMQSAGLPDDLWKPLESSLNPLSRFDFGLFRELPNSKDWQAK